MLILIFYSLWLFRACLLYFLFFFYCICVCFFFFFFCKQTTAYEMRISDWSSERVLFRSRPVGAQHTRCTRGGRGGHEDRRRHLHLHQPQHQCGGVVSRGSGERKAEWSAKDAKSAKVSAKNIQVRMSAPAFAAHGCANGFALPAVAASGCSRHPASRTTCASMHIAGCAGAAGL